MIRGFCEVGSAGLGISDLKSGGILRLGRKRMRLDLEAFQRQKRAGAIVVAVAVATVLLAQLLVMYGSSTSKAYLVVEGRSIPNLAALEKVLREEGKPVAVMFESPTCPVCARMYPYWLKLEEASDSLPVAFYHIMYSGESASAFEKYRVYDTPTFIVFVNGKPVARHVGGFEGENITAVMLSWAIGAAGLAGEVTPEKLAEEGLKIYKSKCSRCHAAIGGLDRGSLEEWLRQGLRMADPLVAVVRDALSKNMSLDEYYGGYGRLMDAVASMRMQGVDLTSYEVDREAYLLTYITHVLLGREPPSINLSQFKALIANSSAGEATPLEEGAASGHAYVGVLGAAAAFAAGVVAAFSPCVLPLLVTQVAALANAGRRVGAGGCVACGLSAFAGVLAMGLLFALVGSLAASIQKLLLPVVSAAIVAAGLASILGVPVEFEASVRLKRGGLVGFCGVYGLLAVQCSLPLVVGSLLLAMGSGGVAGAVVAVSFALGISLPLAAAVYAVSRVGAGFVNRVLARTRLLNLLGGIVLAASGSYLLLYSLGLV